MRGAIGLLPGLTPGEPPSTRVFANARFAAALARGGGWGKGAHAESGAHRHGCCAAGRSRPSAPRPPRRLASRSCVINIATRDGFDCDPAKDAINRAKNGVALSFGRRVFADADHVVLPSFRPINGEDRYKAVGRVDGRSFTAVHVWRDDIDRLISVRRSNASEQGNYDRHSGGPR